MDTWLQVPSSETLWYVFREMYGSVVVCVSNRATDAAYVLLDGTGLEGWSLMATESSRVVGSERALEHTVPANSTCVIGVLTDDGHGQEFSPASVHVHQVSASRRQYAPTTDDDPLRQANETSAEVTAFLKRTSV